RVWLEAHPESGLREHMPYYLESENPAPPPNPDLTPESLTVMDPACGSGHILVYAFDLLAHIYRERGYSDREIPALILEHNLHGLDIDERAAQLASFAVVMKARDLNSRLFRRDMPELNILQVRSTRGLKLPNAGSRDMLGQFSTLSGGLTDADAFNPNDWQPLVSAFEDADHLGSLITPPEFDAGRLRAQLHWLESRGGLDAGALEELRHLLKQAELLGRKYDAVVANPPYMSISDFTEVLRREVPLRFTHGKNDLYSTFILRCLDFLNSSGTIGMVTQHGWMFLSSFSPLRSNIIKETQIESFVHLGARAFPEIGGEIVQNASFIIKKKRNIGASGRYIRLTNVEGLDAKEAAFHNKHNRYNKVPQKDFLSIEDHPLIYWFGDKTKNTFRIPSIGTVAGVDGQNKTGNNDEFLRFHWEITSNSIFPDGWRFYIKGGEFRKWYGNIDYCVNWRPEVRSFYRNSKIARIIKQEYWNISGITWTYNTTGVFNARLLNRGHIFDVNGSSIFPIEDEDEMPILGLLNSSYANEILHALNPTISFQVKEIQKVPYLRPSVTLIADVKLLIQACVNFAKIDWDNFETSWDFQSHPLLRPGTATVSEAFSIWQAQAEAAFRELQRLEEENNRYWIDAYGLQDELTPEVPDEQITIRRADLGRDVRSLLSYAVGCMMGRYSLDEPGLIHAGQPFDPSRHTRFPADRDGILPVPLGGHFEDDVTARFAEFLRVAFAPERVAENMEWVAASLGGQRAGETAEARIRRYFATEFMSDHIQTYKKRPIYWLFTSGKKRGFGALVYLHRYDAGTLARLRTDYLMPLQRKLDADLERVGGERDAAGSTAAKKAAEKRLKEISEQIAEVHKYDESLRHAADLKIPLDLDDGVAYNYWLMSAPGLEYLTGRPLKGLSDLVYTGTDLKMADLERKSQWKRDLLAQERGREEVGA
ncbi:BREX-1 system adenine-specific DNA-methyltransferase PglX, partial [Deinococcus terrestris]